jgi:hypothetical protein
MSALRQLHGRDKRCHEGPLWADHVYIAIFDATGGELSFGAALPNGAGMVKTDCRRGCQAQRKYLEQHQTDVRIVSAQDCPDLDLKSLQAGPRSVGTTKANIDQWREHRGVNTGWDRFAF